MVLHYYVYDSSLKKLSLNQIKNCYKQGSNLDTHDGFVLNRKQDHNVLTYIISPTEYNH